MLDLKDYILNSSFVDWMSLWFSERTLFESDNRLFEQMVTLNVIA